MEIHDFLRCGPVRNDIGNMPETDRNNSRKVTAEDKRFCPLEDKRSCPLTQMFKGKTDYSLQSKLSYLVRI